MAKTGAILAIIAGVLAVISAVLTYVIGFTSFLVGPQEGITAMDFALRGGVCAFLTIFLGCVAIAWPHGAGIGLILVAIAGAIFGSPLVAICMLAALVGGILAVWDGKKPAGKP